MKDKLIVRNWNARGSSADFFCTVHFLYQGPAARMIFRLPKQKSHDRWLASCDTDTGGMRFVRFCLI